jgi:hypothetical protein
MRWLRRKRTGVGLSVLVLLLGLAGIAVAARPPSPAQTVATSGLAATGLDGAGDVVDSTTTSTLPATTPATTSTSSTATTLKPVATTGTTLPVTVPTTAPRPTTTRPFASSNPTPAANPASWSLDDGGISVRLRMEPAAPRVGDTVTLIFDSTATVATDYCCIENVYVDGETVYTNPAAPGPCPLAPGPGEQRATFRAAHAGTVTLQVQASRARLCSPPPVFDTANLRGVVWVAAG